MGLFSREKFQLVAWAPCFRPKLSEKRHTIINQQARSIIILKYINNEQMRWKTCMFEHVARFQTLWCLRSMVDFVKGKLWSPIFFTEMKHIIFLLLSIITMITWRLHTYQNNRLYMLSVSQFNTDQLAVRISLSNQFENFYIGFNLISDIILT